MAAVFGESERSEPEIFGQRSLKLELNIEGEQQQFVGVTGEVPPEQPAWSVSVNQEGPEHPYIKEEVSIEEEEPDITTVTVKMEEDHLSGFDQSLKEENREDNRAAEPAGTSGPEGQFRADQQPLLKTPRLEQDEAESFDLRVKEEADVVAVKIEESEEEAEDCGGPGLARNSGPDGHFEQVTEDETHSSETEDSGDWMTPVASPSLKMTKTNQTVDCNVRGNTCDKLSSEFGQKPFSCSECSKRFTRKDHLRRHERLHQGEKPFSCCECDRRFTDKRNLRRHERIHTGEKPFSCSECGKRFAQKDDLVRHERIHTGEKPFGCSECGKMFTKLYTLKMHERIHTGEKPFVCSECGKGFTQKNNLMFHKRIHTGEKPFSCSECGKRFTLKDVLKKHERIHTGEKPFSCLECGKGFAGKSNLRVHERIHTGERPFSCPQCDKTFKQSRELRTHEKIHTGEKLFCCYQCGTGFVRKDHLKKHEKIHTR